MSNLWIMLFIVSSFLCKLPFRCIYVHFIIMYIVWESPFLCMSVSISEDAPLCIVLWFEANSRNTYYCYYNDPFLLSGSMNNSKQVHLLAILCVIERSSSSKCRTGERVNELHWRRRLLLPVYRSSLDVIPAIQSCTTQVYYIIGRHHHIEANETSS